MVPHPGAVLLEALDLAGEETHLVGFGQAEIEVPAQHVVELQELVGDAVGHGDEVLGAAPQ